MLFYVHMEPFYEFLNKLGIYNPPDAFEFVFKLSDKELQSFLENCFELLHRTNFDSNAVITPFDFSVSDTLSGGMSPCSDVQCRVESIYKLSLFSALYANTVTIENPFHYLPHFLNEKKKKTFDEYFRYKVSSDLTIFLHCKLLVEAGIMKITPLVLHLCASCLTETISYEKELEKELFLIENKITEDLSDRIEITLDKKGAYLISGGSDYVHTFALIPKKPPKSLKPFYQKAPYTFTKKEVHDLGLISTLGIVGRALNNLFTQKYSVITNKLSYLTDVPLEGDIIRALGKTSDGVLRGDLPEEMISAVPFCYGVNVSDVLKLRENESSAFQTYRDAVTKLVKLGEGENSLETKDLYNQIVLPEINNIQRIIDASKNDLTSKAKRKVAFNTTLLTVGAIGGKLLNIDLIDLLAKVSPAALYSLNDIYGDVQESRSTPQEALKNSYYFLWRLKNQFGK